MTLPTYPSSTNPASLINEYLEIIGYLNTHPEFKVQGAPYTVFVTPQFGQAVPIRVLEIHLKHSLGLDIEGLTNDRGFKYKASYRWFKDSSEIDKYLTNTNNLDFYDHIDYNSSRYVEQT